MKRSRLASVGAFICAGLFVLPACASTSSQPGNGSTSKPGAIESVAITMEPKTKELIPTTPTEEWCGDTPATVGIFDGIPLDAWRRIGRAVYINEMKKCPAVDPDFFYVSAGSDQQKAISDMDALVAQGFTLITGFADYGEAQLPAIRAATAAGATVVPYGNRVGGTPGVDYAATTLLDQVTPGREIATGVAKLLGGKGKVVSIGGVAGAPSAQAFFDGVKEGLAKFPDITLINDEFIVTDWSPVEAQRQMAAIISQHSDISAVIIDYGGTAAPVANAFVDAGLPIPTLGVLGAANEIACLWEDHKGKASEFDIVSSDSIHALYKAAAQQGIAAATGGKYNVVQAFHAALTNNTAEGKNPTCDRSLPVDTDFTSPLELDELVGVLKEAQQ